MALLNEVTDSKSVFGGISRGEALVRHVKEGEKLLFLDKVRNFPPLSGGGIDTRGVVSAGMQEDDSTLWSVLRIRVSIDRFR